MKKILIIIVFLTIGIRSFSEGGASYFKLTTDSLILSHLSNMGLKTLAVNDDGVVICDTISLDKRDSAITYYTPSFIEFKFATKAELDAVQSAASIKLPVDVSTITGQNLDLNGVETIDLVTTTTGMRVLVRNQTNTAQNGIYIAGAAAWSRASDFDSWAELYRSYVVILDGETLKGAAFVSDIASTGTVGVTAIAFNLFNTPSSVVAGAGLIKVGDQIYVDVDGSTIEINSNKLRIKDAGVTDAKIATGINAAKLTQYSTAAYNSNVWNGSNNIPIQGAIRNKIYTDSIFFKNRFDDAMSFIQFAQQGDATYAINYYIDGTYGTGQSLPLANSLYSGAMPKTAFNKLAGIEALAEKNVPADWAETNTALDSYIKNKPTIALAKDSSLFTPSGTSPTKTATAKAGINQIKIDGANTINQITLGSSTSVVDGVFQNVNGMIKVENSNQSGLTISSGDGAVFVYNNGNPLYYLPTTGGTEGNSIIKGAGTSTYWGAGTGGTGGSGTVTSVAASGVTGLFTTNVATPTTTPVITNTLSAQTPNNIFASSALGVAGFQAMTDEMIPNVHTNSGYATLNTPSGFTAKVTMSANSSSTANFRLTPGISNPSAAVDGDFWINGTILYCRLNSANVPLGSVSGGTITSFTTDPLTGLYEAGTATNPYPKITISGLAAATALLTDEIMFSQTASVTTPKTLKKTTLNDLKTLIGSTFALTVAESDGTPTVTDVNSITFDGATITDDGGGAITLTVEGGGVTESAFSVLATTGTIAWSWLASNNAQIGNETMGITGNVTLTIPVDANYNGMEAELWVYQHATTARTITFPTGFYFTNGHSKTFPIPAGDLIYIFTFKSNGTNTRIDYATGTKAN